VSHLAKQGIKETVIACSQQVAAQLPDLLKAEEVAASFISETLPGGTAGCLRDAVRDRTESTILVFPASLTCPPTIQYILDAHRESRSDLTLMLNPNEQDKRRPGQPSGIFACNSGVLKQVPAGGYCDIKEGLIPEIVRSSNTVYGKTLAAPAGDFRDWREYLRAMTYYIEQGPCTDADPGLKKWPGSENAWVAGTARIDSAARVRGSCIILDGATIASGAVILGPTVIGRDVHIGKDSIVSNSMIWDGANIGAGCLVRHAVMGYNALVSNHTTIECDCVACGRRKITTTAHIPATADAAKSAPVPSKPRASRRTVRQGKPQYVQILQKLNPHHVSIFGAVSILGALLWCFWPTLRELWEIWQKNDEYSSGLLVPFLAVYVLWSRRHEFSRGDMRPSLILGLLGLLGAQVFRLLGVLFWYASAERLSIVLTVGALVILLLGWEIFRKVFTTVLFLFLMLPLPNRVQAAMAQPLQRWATSSAVFGLEMMGYEVTREGNIIRLGETSVAVAEACNGLRMVTAFIVISALVVLLVKRSWWEKLIILASSLPIALLCNTVRLTITSIAFTLVHGERWEQIFHDFGGYAMMPLALVVVVAELWLMKKLMTPPGQTQEVVIKRRSR
jgi:exosortase